MKHAVLSALFLCSTAHGVNNLRWWTDRGVVSSNTDAMVNDYAAVNQGQLKWMATQCAKELDSRLPGGAGESVWQVVNKFSFGNNNLPVNLGQLKHTAQPFYERLWPDYTNSLPQDISGASPWAFPSGVLNDYALANLGQLKHVFSFDFDTAGLPVQMTVTVSGNISYSGTHTGNVIVTASTTANGWGRAYSDVLSLPGSYSITLPAGYTYWLRAFRDSDNSGQGNGSEPWGRSLLNPLSVTSDVTGVNIVLTDVGSDGDTLDDWWELNTFGDLNQTGSMDADGDGLTNEQEENAGTDAMLADTDGDGIEDGVENLTSPVLFDTDGDGLHDGIEAGLMNSVGTYGSGGILIYVPYGGYYHIVEPELKMNFLGE